MHEKKNREQIEFTVIDSLSYLIRYHSKQVANEQRYPQADPDKMDEIISDGKNMVKKLNIIRDELENLFTGMI